MKSMTRGSVYTGLAAALSVIGALTGVSVPSALADLASEIKLGEPAYNGSGCPMGSASVSLAPDGSALSLLFDQYVVEAGGITGKRLDRKNCNISIPVHVPQGLSVSIIQVDYRGFNSLPLGSRSMFNVEYFLAGSRGPRVTRSFLGPQDREYLISNPLELSAIVWSPCGADVNLRANSSMTVYTNSRGDQVLSTVDSADVTAGIVYHLQWRHCGGGPIGGFNFAL